MINLLYKKMYFIARKLWNLKRTARPFLKFFISIVVFNVKRGAVESAFPRLGDSTETTEGLFDAGLEAIEKRQFDWWTICLLITHFI